jgi:hypothetical protein
MQELLRMRYCGRAKGVTSSGWRATLRFKHAPKSQRNLASGKYQKTLPVLARAHTIAAQNPWADRQATTTTWEMGRTARGVLRLGNVEYEDGTRGSHCFTKPKRKSGAIIGRTIHSALFTLKHEQAAAVALTSATAAPRP